MRSLSGLILATLLGALSAACATSRSAEPAFFPMPPRTAWIVDAEGRAVGQATLAETPHGLLIRLEISAHGLPPGWHGVHMHAVGDCSDPAAGFVASGGHVGRGEGPIHGFANVNGPEYGDLPNLFVSAEGLSGAEFYTTWLSLRPDIKGRADVIDADGSALVIHAEADDHAHQPIGGSGARIACAAFSAMP